MLSFVKYWEKNNKFIDNKKFIEDEVKLKKHKTDDNYACVICGKGADNSEKLNQLKIFAEDVSDSSRTLVASTENLFMPLVQFAFLFPILVLWISKACNANLPMDHHNKTSNDDIEFESMKKTPKKWLDIIESNWTSVLLLFSILTSLVSLSGAQTAIYFAAPGKRNQKTLPRQAFIFVLSMMQVVPKVLACEAFAFGFVASYMESPNLMFLALFFLPIVLTIWKGCIIWIGHSIERRNCQLALKEAWRIFLSPFFFTILVKEVEVKDEDIDEEDVLINDIQLLTGSYSQFSIFT